MKNQITEQAKQALRAEYSDWRHENSLHLLQQYEKASSIIGEEKMAPFELFAQIYFSELVMLTKGRQIKEKLKVRMEKEFNSIITVTE